MFDHFSLILEVFLAVGCGFVLLLPIVGSLCPLFSGYLVLLYAIRSGCCVVCIEGEDEEQTITLLHEGGKEQLGKLEEELSRKIRELSVELKHMQPK